MAQGGPARRQPSVNRAALRSGHGRKENPCVIGGARTARPRRLNELVVANRALVKAIATGRPMTRRNTRIVSEYLREAGWGEGAIDAATAPAGARVDLRETG